MRGPRVRGAAYGEFFLSTLRSYVEALGGRLEVRAVFEELTVDLKISKT